MEWAADLQSLPAVKSVPESAQSGRCLVRNGQLQWRSNVGGIEDVSITTNAISSACRVTAFSDKGAPSNPRALTNSSTTVYACAEKQTTKDSPKLRIVLTDNSAYVFKFASATDRDAVIAALSADAVPGASTPSPSGNLAAHLTAGSSAIKRGSTLAAAMGFSSSTFDPLSGADLGSLKAELLQKDAQLASQYSELVGSSLITESQFWHARRGALVDAYSRKTKVGLSSVAPESLLAAEGTTTVKMDQAAKVQIFVKQPKVFEAFKEFVNTAIPEREFWSRFFVARQLREQQPLTAQAGNKQQVDMKKLSVDQFFDLYQRGAIDDGAQAGVAMVTRKRSAIGGVDPAFDLLASVEENPRARRAAESKSGYGTGGVSYAYDADVPLNGSVSKDKLAEAAAQRERKAEEVIREVNRYSALVIDPQAVERSMLGIDSRASGQQSKMSAAAVRYTPRVSPTAVGASMADDLPDLRRRAPLQSGFAQLQVDMSALREGLRVQGQHDAAAAELEVAADSEAAAVGGWTVLDASSVDGSSSTRKLSVDHTPALAGKKRPRAAMEALADVDTVPAKPDPLASVSKSSKASRSVLLSVVQGAHVIFDAQQRSRGGFANVVPAHWQAYIVQRAVMDNQIAMHTWTVVRALEKDRGAGNPAASSDEDMRRCQRLLKELESQHDMIDALKVAVERGGVMGVQPPGVQVPTGAEAERQMAAAQADPHGAKAEVVKLLILLERYLEPTILAAKKVLNMR